MKILRVINSLAMGGAERSIASNVPRHIENGIEMDVLLLNGMDAIFKNELLENGVKVMELGKFNDVYNPFLSLKLMKYLRKYDLVHVHLFPSLYWVAIAKLLSFSKTKLVFTEHSTTHRRASWVLLQKIDRIIYRQYEMIITISEAADTNLKKRIGTSYPTQLIYNGVDIENLKEEAAALNEELEERFKDKEVLLHVAGFRIEKDQDTLIRALTHLHENFVAIFIGDGDRMGICKQLAMDLGVNHRVFFMGNQSNVGKWIALSKIVVMSSHWEGFGRAAVEGMALSKPVIASNVSGLAQVVGDAGLLFEKGNEVELSEHILSISNDHEKYQALAQKGCLKAKDYDLKKMIQAYEKVYNQLISKS